MRPQDLVGLDVLVGLTYLDAKGQVLRQEQFHGRIETTDGSTTWVRPSGGGEPRWVPTEMAAFRPAPSGTYRLESTGQVVIDPFLLTSWMLTVLQDEEGETYYEAEPNFAPLTNSRVPREWELTYRIDEPRIRRTIEVFGDQYIGRNLLLGITYVTPSGTPHRQEQVVGTIMVVDFDEGIVVSCEPDGRQLVLPGDPSWLEKAPQAEFMLRSTGQVVTNPNYIAKLTKRSP
ncbi:hypothetical protein SAMN05444166_3638 [Singulisphaera sp. GP187]|uniref:hypothetical protein n=1 Tax=Singulisphaera sp. GP187 TaxID=1882752 RepID=UPI000925ECF6|nr:hypothetical protein [Singulisphaera sp. GP187]SIO30536.1 hypothetical protein SAMN05444166_3638 [Singulisphaera sp. GP187]